MRLTLIFALLALLLSGFTHGQCTASSDFASGNEDWRIEGDAQGSRDEPDWAVGQISAEDNQSGDYWYFVAPAPYVGNRSCTYGGTLSFELNELDGGSNVLSGHIVTLFSGEQVLDWAPVEPPAADGWVRFEVPLLPGPGWTFGDEAVTDAQFQDILLSLDALFIRGEFVSGYDQAALRSVRMSSGVSNSMWIPILASLVVILTLLGGARLAQNRRDVDNVAKKAQKAIDDAKIEIKKAQKADDAKALAFAKTKLNAAKNAKKKAKNAERKADRAMEQFKQAKINKSQRKIDKSEEDRSNAKENKRFAKRLTNEAKGILKDLDGIAGARKTLEDLGFRKKEIDDLLSDINSSKYDPEGKPVTPDGQAGISGRQAAGPRLQLKGVDLMSSEGKKKLKSASKAINDLFHAEGEVGDGIDAPYPE